MRPSQSPTRAIPTLTLRIAGLGHHFELTLPSTSTLADLKLEIERRTDLPPEYQRLVAKSIRMEDDSMLLGGTVYEAQDESNFLQVAGLGLRDRTKILLLHSSRYEADAEGVDRLNELLDQISEVDARRAAREIGNKEVHELITQLCCKIDGVETNGSEALRKMRKMTIGKAEMVERKCDETKRGIDP